MTVPLNVLIVDDIDTNRRVLRALLESVGIRALEAADGVEALARLRQEKTGVIISDILMPRMDGYQLCQRVRKTPRLSKTPFIFYTSAYVSPSDEKLAMDCGADCYIKKPAPVGVILGAIRELSDARRRRHAPAALAEESLVMREYSESLVRKLEERNQSLEEARAQIARVNEELEKRVAERTAELLLANQQLEAFNHSIAHDLRSPLTAIDGFSYLLVEECRGKVSASAMKGLGSISEAANRINDLVNDLLRLARANDAQISLETVNLTELATAVLQDLQARNPGKTTKFTVQPGVSAQGDFGLLKIAFENLLRNAWRDTAKTAHARIDFGVETRAGSRVFFVRHNGAGFDRIVPKLFGLDVRVRSTEYGGMGIGLSTVQRIVTRHEGRIWAEAASGRGGVYLFTLGSKQGKAG